MQIKSPPQTTPPEPVCATLHCQHRIPMAGIASSLGGHFYATAAMAGTFMQQLQWRSMQTAARVTCRGLIVLRDNHIAMGESMS